MNGIAEWKKDNCLENDTKRQDGAIYLALYCYYISCIIDQKKKCVSYFLKPTTAAMCATAHIAVDTTRLDEIQEFAYGAMALIL